MAGSTRVLARVPGDFLADSIMLSLLLAMLFALVFPVLQIIERFYPAASPFIWVGMIALAINAYSAGIERGEETNQLVDQLQEMSVKQISQFLLLVVLIGSFAYGIQLGVSGFAAVYIASQTGYISLAIVFAFAFPIIDAYGARKYQVSVAYLGLKISGWIFDTAASFRDTISGISPERPHEGVHMAKGVFSGLLGIDPPEPIRVR